MSLIVLLCCPSQQQLKQNKVILWYASATYVGHEIDLAVAAAVWESSSAARLTEHSNMQHS